jgi:hypothetical protein
MESLPHEYRPYSVAETLLLSFPDRAEDKSTENPFIRIRPLAPLTLSLRGEEETGADVRDDMMPSF